MSAHHRRSRDPGAVKSRLTRVPWAGIGSPPGVWWWSSTVCRGCRPSSRISRRTRYRTVSRVTPSRSSTATAAVTAVVAAGRSRRNRVPRTPQRPRARPKPGLELVGRPGQGPPGRVRHRVGLLPQRGLRLRPWSGCRWPKTRPPRAQRPAPSWASRPRPRPTPPTTPHPPTAEAVAVLVGALHRHLRPMERRCSRAHHRPVRSPPRPAPRSRSHRHPRNRQRLVGLVGVSRWRRLRRCEPASS